MLRRRPPESSVSSNDPDCGCAPTLQEQADLASGAASRSARGLLTRRTLIGASALGLVGLAAVGSMQPAFAQDYPSWDDVEAARANESSKAAEITRIETLINNLQANVVATRAEAERLAQEYYFAQQEFYEAADRAVELQRQADEQAALADDAAQKAAAVATQIYRNGSDDPALELFLSGSSSNADDLLQRLGTMDKLLERNTDLYSAAITAANTAQSLGDQAVEARNERDRLQKVAESKMMQAQDAADAAEAALLEQETNLVVLQAQLMALRDTTAKTIADYEAGVEAERKAREEAERRAREEAARLAAQKDAERRAAAAAAEAAAAEAAAAQASSGGSGGGGSPAPAPAPAQSGGGSTSNGGAVVGSGWARPNSGWMTSPYGVRGTICSGGSCTTNHRGTDLAAGCGSGNFAAGSGTVIWAGYLGDWGNFVKIDHGNGVQTGYAHAQNGSIAVRRGQWVEAGQLISREGNTGLSRGCHLHFEVYVNDYRIDPAPFMAERGVYL